MLQFPLHSGSAKPQLQQECVPSEAFFLAGLFSCVKVKSVFPLQKRRTCVWAAACVTAEQLAGGNLFICKKERAAPELSLLPQLLLGWGLPAETG